MIILAILVILIVLFWLLFSDSLIQMWYDYLASLEVKKERRKNPPACIDCKYRRDSEIAEEFDICRHTRAVFTFAETERNNKFGECGKYAKLFEEKV